MFFPLKAVFLFLEKPLKLLAKQGGGCNRIPQFVELLLIGRTGNPQTDVAVDGVFLVHVLTESLPMLFVV